ncbi:2-methylcitrate synthase [Planoprotostelium fungivorum]|uniref:Citrate synthase n=1 Tax=Planoprotostelium fungivorum TaxID=1890364 RepID=A0A2P6NXE1_9EUKA|nr:2-methylcitrate synthase [Planoprotostelium fungivorum]
MNVDIDRHGAFRGCGQILLINVDIKSETETVSSHWHRKSAIQVVTARPHPHKCDSYCSIYRPTTAQHKVQMLSRVSLRISSQKNIRFSSTELKNLMREKYIPNKREQLTRIKKSSASVIGQTTVEQVLGGMRGIRCMWWEGSELDAEKGITFHGKTIEECNRILPHGPEQGATQMLPESMMWLIMTGEVPTEKQVRALSADLARHSALPRHVDELIDNLPKDMHPMTSLSAAIASLSHNSVFSKQYSDGSITKDKFWEPAFDDSISLLAKIPTIAAKLYNRSKGVSKVYKADESKDVTWNFAENIGFGDKLPFVEMMRLYLALHADHEGGNVSAHSTHLVGSALSDPFLSYSAGLLGLAGPLHGLAAQDVLRFILQMHQWLPKNYTEKDVEQYLWNWLKDGRVVPGYGHAVLRKPDPRFTALHEFSSKSDSISKDPHWKLVDIVSRVAPQVLKEHGKTKNPFPNVDSQSGVLLHHYGMKETEFYTVIFGISRAYGVLPQLVWDRALGMPIERPKSLSLNAIEKMMSAQ